MKFYVMEGNEPWREISVNPFDQWRDETYKDHKYWLRTMKFVCYNRKRNFWFKVQYEHEIKKDKN